MKERDAHKRLDEAALQDASLFGWHIGKRRGGSKARYEDVLFGAPFVHRIDIRFAEADWADLQEHPTDKTKYTVDTVIDGETLKNATISTKGVSSLVFPAIKPDVRRYSYEIKFGKRKKNRTYRGLDKLDLNCCFCDTTLMKDHFSYRLFRVAGVPAPLTSYAWVTVNGEDYSLYLIVEKPEESFLKRNFGKGVIYKPSASDMGMTMEEAQYLEDNGIPEDYLSAEARGADFVYVDNNPASYPGIFECRKTGGGKKDDAAVIASIKTLSRGTNLEKGLDVHEVIRFFAVHNFLLNIDSYTGTGLHNMVICEKDGILSVMPWDYNLAFGTCVTGVGKELLEDPTDLLNQGIDTPLIGADEESRPLWAWIVQNEEYRQEYHDVLSNLVEGYFESGLFEYELDVLQAILAPFEEKDPNAFYSIEEFSKGCDTLRQFCLRRAQSVRKQLSGELAMDSAKQNEADKVSASGLNVADMGAYAYLPKE